jgi:hypothetical protein
VRTSSPDVLSPMVGSVKGLSRPRSELQVEDVETCSIVSSVIVRCDPKPHKRLKRTPKPNQSQSEKEARTQLRKERKSPSKRRSRKVAPGTFSHSDNVSTCFVVKPPCPCFSVDDERRTTRMTKMRIGFVEVDNEGAGTAPSNRGEVREDEGRTG